MDYILSMSTQERTILERLKAKITERLPLSRLVLFGSRARGDADPDSDMDILVVLDGPVERQAEQYVRLCAWELSFEQGIILVPITVSRTDWDEGLLSASLLAIAVRQEGVAV